MIRVCTVLALALLGACSADPIEVTTRALEHPSEVAFACYHIDGATREMVPLGDCGATEDERRSRRNFLHALVTQSGRGEVAAIDLDAVRVIDSDRRVPGFTFVPVGEMPKAIVVPRGDSSRTFVADVGSHDVYVVPTLRFRFPEVGGATGVRRVPLPAAPTDLALSPDEQRLFVTLPDLGAVGVIPIGGGTLGALELVELFPDVSRPMDAAPPEERYCRVCRDDLVAEEGPLEPCRTMLDPYPIDEADARLPFPAREPVARGEAPMPVSLAVDAAGGWLLVGDLARPVVHVLDLETDPPTVVSPIVTSVPTDGIALTPPVPTTAYDAASPLERYLYAIDATDRSVLAMRYDGTIPARSAVLPVSARSPMDRLGLTSGARTLAVITPGYPERLAGVDLSADLADRLCDPAMASEADLAAPLQLRGVFLAVGLLEGNVAITDVYDLDAPCRGGALCKDPRNVEDVRVYIQRHRPRIAQRLSEGMRITSGPIFSTNQVSFPVGPDGTTEGDLTPDLGPVTCGHHQIPVFGGTALAGATTTPPLICALGDPWAAEAETWTVSWEAAIPGTSGGRGRFAAAEDALFVEVPACDRGVLGRLDVAALDPAIPEAGFGGDLVAITGGLPPTTEDLEACQVLVEEDGDPREIEIPIERAERRTGAGGDLQHVLLLADRARNGIDLARIRQCFPELVSYEIRVQGAYTVVGGRTGYRHRGVVGADGSCTVSLAADPTRLGRALPGRAFDNGLVHFQIELAEDEERRLGPADEAQLSFQLGQVPAKLRIGIGDDIPTILSDVAFNEVDGRLYAVDAQFRGLVQIQVTPVQILRAFE